jgi:hypothetical protein
MVARVVRIGNRDWVAGLSWRSFEDVPSKAELREDAEQLKASWATVRVGEEAVQGGFCKPIEGVKNPNKLCSLAAMMADSHREPWLGIFKIDADLFWYIAVRDGHAILLDGDVIGTEQEILDARERHLAIGDWEYVTGNLDNLKELLDSIDAKPSRLKSLNEDKSKPVMIAAAAVVAVGALGGGAYWWHAKQQADEQARLAAIQSFRARMAASKPQVVTDPNASAMPAPADWLRACGQIMYPLALSRNGWLLDQVGCDSKSVVVRWVIGEGATVANKPPGVVSDDGNADVDRISIGNIKPRDSRDVIALGDAKLAARAWAQAGGYQLAFSGAPEAPHLPGAPAAPVAPSNQVVVAIDMGVSPLRPESMRQLTSLPGLRLMGMKTTETGWHLEGVIYGR